MLDISEFGQQILTAGLAFFAGAFVGLPLSTAECSAAGLKVSPSDLQIAFDPGALEGRAFMVLDVSGAGDVGLTDPKDLETPNPPPLNVTFSITGLPSSGDTQHWLIATVKGLTDMVTQQRFLSFSLGQQSVTLPYYLSNCPTKDFAWSVRAPTTEISLRPSQAIEICFSVWPVPATGVALIQAAFVEQTTKAIVGDGWELCGVLPACNDHTFSIPANSQERLWLRPKGGAEVVGKYFGSLVIGAAQKRDGETATMSISGTQNGRSSEKLEMNGSDDFLAVRRAVLRGIIVVEAAGNGAQDLDNPFYDTPNPSFSDNWKNPFRSANDSGAILVGAGAPPSGQFGPDRSRLDFSNYGSRVDCQGWGRGVVSTGYGDLYGGTEDAFRTIAYTAEFSGTSSASPIVTSVIACLQGIARRIGNRPDLAALIAAIKPSI